MLHKNYQFITQGKLKFPVLGLLITFGILNLGVIGERTKINLKSTATAANLHLDTRELQGSNENSLLSGLRDIRDKRNQQYLNDLNNDLNTVAPQDVQSQGLNINLHNVLKNTRQIRGRSPVNFPEKDGIYLYGQSSIPNQLGQGYIVFQKHQGKVIGALYMPNSEFSCFQGTIAQSGELAMTVTSSPGEVGITQVSTASRIPNFTGEDTATYAYSVALQDYHQLGSVSPNDRQILQACSQNLR